MTNEKLEANLMALANAHNELVEQHNALAARVVQLEEQAAKEQGTPAPSQPPIPGQPPPPPAEAKKPVKVLPPQVSPKKLQR